MAYGFFILISIEKANQPYFWSKVSGEAIGIVKGFIDIFYFEEMVHGNFPHGSINAQSLGSVTRRNFTSPISSPISSPFSSPMRDGHRPVVSKKKDFLSGNRFLLNVGDFVNFNFCRVFLLNRVMFYF